MSPYRTAAPKAHPIQRCCGQCDQSVGGCLQRVQFDMGRFRSPLPAGRSERAPGGTRPLVSLDGGATWADDPKAIQPDGTPKRVDRR